MGKLKGKSTGAQTYSWEATQYTLACYLGSREKMIKVYVLFRSLSWVCIIANLGIGVTQVRTSQVYRKAAINKKEFEKRMKTGLRYYEESAFLCRPAHYHLISVHF